MSKCTVLAYDVAKIFVMEWSRPFFVHVRVIATLYRVFYEVYNMNNESG